MPILSNCFQEGYRGTGRQGDKSTTHPLTPSPLQTHTLLIQSTKLKLINIMNKISTFLTLSSLTLVGSFIASAPAAALDFSLENQTGNDYTYTVTLDADDSLGIGDQLILTNLSGVTAASASSPYTLGGFDETSANFSVDTATSGAANLTGVISLTSPDSLAGLEYQAFFTDNGTPSVANGSVSSAAVPFEFSPGLGIILLAGGFGLRQLKRKLRGCSKITSHF